MRLLDWEVRLADYLAERRSVPFAWGSNDCVRFAAGAVLAMTGVDPAADFRGKYRTQAGAARVLRKTGSSDLVSAISGRFDVIAVMQARRGDLVFDGEAVGLCVGAQAAFVGVEGTREGLGLVPLTEMKKAWSVP